MDRHVVRANTVQFMHVIFECTTFSFSYICWKIINRNSDKTDTSLKTNNTHTPVVMKSCLILFVCLVANLCRQSSVPFFSRTHLVSSQLLSQMEVPTHPPSPFLTYRYLKLQLPCLGGCDVTGGISNVILVSRRDRSRKCLMNDEALCSDRPDVCQAARGGKGFLKSRPSLSGPGGSPRVRMNQREVTISI